MSLSHSPGQAQCDFGEALGSSGEWSARPTASSWTCPTATAASSRPTPRRPPRPSGTATCRHSPSWVECPKASCRTTPSWRWPGSWATDAVSAPGPSPSCSLTTGSRTGSGAPARATTRGRSRGWWATCAATSWCQCRPSRVLTRLNAHLERSCLGTDGLQCCRGHSETIGQRMERDLDLDTLLPRPEAPYDACDQPSGRVSSLSSGPVPDQRLLGAGGLRTPGRHGARLRGPGGHQLRVCGHRPPSPLLRAG